MKNSIFIILAIIIVSCSRTSQKNTSTSSADSASTATANENETKSATPTKNIILNNPTEPEEKNSGNKENAPVNKNNSNPVTSVNNKSELNYNNVPSCLKKLIAGFKAEDVQNPPRKIYSYTYNKKTVYYVTPPCCDFFSDLYDSDCKLIAHPDGGITGKGDGRARDFIETRKNEKLVWEDTRKQ